MFHLPVERQPLLSTGMGSRQVALGERDPSQEKRRHRHTFLVTDLPLERDTFLQEWVKQYRLSLREKEGPSPLRQGSGEPPLVPHLLEEGPTVLKQDTGAGVLTLLCVEQSQGKEQPGDAPLVVESAKEGEPLLHQDTGGSKIAASPGSRAQTIQRERHAPPIPQLPE